MPFNERLKEFSQKNRMKGKGPLCVALVVTRHGKKLGMPLDPEAAPEGPAARRLPGPGSRP